LDGAAIFVGERERGAHVVQEMVPAKRFAATKQAEKRGLNTSRRSSFFEKS
jgi:hypothetical protein